MDDFDDSGQIPEYLQSCAIILGGEKAWSREDALAFIQWLSENQRAVDGIEVWVRSTSALPEIPSPYIYTWTVDDQAEEEPWSDYVERSCNAASNYVRGFAWDERDRSYLDREPFFNLAVASHD